MFLSENETVVVGLAADLIGQCGLRVRLIVEMHALGIIASLLLTIHLPLTV